MTVILNFGMNRITLPRSSRGATDFLQRISSAELAETHAQQIALSARLLLY
jgi:hypothetical protein